LGDRRKLEELQLSANVIKNKAGARLVEGLDINQNLTMLSLRHCSLKKKTLIAVAKAVRKHPSLRLLDLAMNPEASQPDVTKEIEDMISLATKLEEINLAACEFSHSAIQTIAGGVGRSSTLKVIHLDANKVGKSLAKFADAAKSNKKLETLTFKKCDISKKDVALFFSALTVSTLKLLLLDANELERKDVETHAAQFPGLTINV